MNIWIPIIITSIAGLSTILGNILLFIDDKYKDRVISFSMGLAFIVMFLISIFDLIPEGIRLVSDSFNIYELFIYSLLLLLIGYVFVVFIDNRIDSDSKLFKIGILSMISLLIHNIPEGIICAISSVNDINLGFKMSFMIMLHNIPEGIVISLPIYYVTKSRGKALLYTVISSLGEIVGAIITVLFLYRYINDYIMYIVFIITAGIMITLSVSKILKEGISFKLFKWLILGVLVGFSIVVITM
ncbi:MAG: ZIP family metal transporter [Bacilli bacterium]|nr:ZIP family metal transporter [Bacilli bacterium]